MSLGEMSAADIAAVTGNGNGFGWGGDGWWIVLLLLFANNGFGGGFGGDGMMPYFFNNQTQNDVNRGFADAGLSNQLSGIQSSLNTGFASAEVAGCNRAMDAMQTAYGNQIASMNQRFADVTTIGNRLDDIQMQQQQCCCDSKAQTADLKYTVATDGAATRSAISDAKQQVLDKLCALEIDGLKSQLADRDRTIVSQNNIISSMKSENYLQNVINAQTLYLRPPINPAWIVNPPYQTPTTDAVTPAG